MHIDAQDRTLIWQQRFWLSTERLWMQVYRFLTGGDNSEFCHKVTKALSEGWILHGSPGISAGVDGKTVCGQAVTKDVGEQTYDPEKKLADY